VRSEPIGATIDKFEQGGAPGIFVTEWDLTVKKKNCKCAAKDAKHLPVATMSSYDTIVNIYNIVDNTR